ncbi:hemin uptake protein HemP [Ochrobactrum sp. CM-21-5]|nr:hemin uptake protein HemP [Ochrobactrum sp. CM-21-5]MBC2885380.1 hemin uptake protein HemP [Ochrobactrum sp. CM-21-5]
MNRRIYIDMQVRLPRERLPAAMAEASRDKTGETAAHPSCGVSPDPRLKTYGSGELFEGSREVGIEHGGSLYRLKITRQGKLILNK